MRYSYITKYVAGTREEGYIISGSINHLHINDPQRRKIENDVYIGRDSQGDTKYYIPETHVLYNYFLFEQCVVRAGIKRHLEFFSMMHRKVDYSIIQQLKKLNP